MAGETPALVVKVATDLTGLQAGMQQTQAAVETTTAKIDQLASTLTGSTATATAGAEKMASAVAAVGASAVATVANTDALTTATNTMVGAQERTQTTAQQLKSSFGEFDSLLNSVGVHFSKQTKALEEIAAASGKTAGELGALSTAGLAVGTAMASWDLTRRVMEFFQLDGAVAPLWTHLLGLADVTKVTAAVQQDTIAKAIAEGAEKTVDYAQAVQYLTWKHVDYQHALADLTHEGLGWRDVLGTINKSVADQAINLLELGRDHKAVQDAFHLTDLQMKALVFTAGEKTKADKEAAAAQKELDAAMVEVNSTGATWQETLGKMSAATRDHINALLAAGVSEHAIQVLLKVTTEQIHAVTEARKLDKATLEAHAASQKLAMEESVKVAKQLTEQQQARTKEVNDAIVAELKAGDALKANTTSTDKATQALRDYNAAMDDLHRHKVDNISQTNQEQVITDKYTQALLDEAKAQDQANAAMAKVPDVAKPAADHVQQLTGQINLGITSLEAYNQAIKDFYDSFGPGLVGTPAPMALGGHRTPGLTAEAAAPWLVGPGHAAGGPVDAGVAYPVGERGPELFIPNVPGSIAPSGGATIVQHITITQPLGTSRAIADAVGTATMQALQNRGERFRPAGV